MYTFSGEGWGRDGASFKWMVRFTAVFFPLFLSGLTLKRKDLFLLEHFFYFNGRLHF